MARLRVIKPDFWCSGQVASCSRDARLLFIGLWNFCDDAGVHPASPKRLKMEVFPGDNCSEDEIISWINELKKNSLIEEYEVQNTKYWRVTGWHHQKIYRPFYKYPSPKSNEPSQSKPRLEIVETVNDQCRSSAQAVNEQRSDNPVYINRNIDRDIEDICQVANATRPISFTDNSDDKPILEIFNYWQSILGHPKAKLDKKRTTKIKIALKNYSPDDLKKAIDGCTSSKFHMGENNDKKRYDGIDLIFRDAEHIEKFIEIAEQKSNNDFGDSLLPAPNSLFAGAI